MDTCPFLMALLYFTKVSAYSTIAEVFPKASHDCLTRMLNGEWSGKHSWIGRCAYYFWLWEAISLWMIRW